MEPHTRAQVKPARNKLATILLDTFNTPPPTLRAKHSDPHPGALRVEA